MDLFDIPNIDQTIQRFYGSGGPNDWFTWIKPRGVKMISILCIGGGGGGGGGFTRMLNTSGGGGGGGGSSAFSRIVIPAHLLPDALFVFVGKGGTGGTAGNNGTVGGLSTVSVVSGSTVPANVLLRSSSGNAGAGSAGTVAAGGAAGGASTIATVTQMILSGLGLPIMLAGSGGGAGGTATGAAGANTSFLYLTGAAPGGAGVTTTEYKGGDFTGAGFMPTILGGAAGSNNGADGIILEKPFCSAPGSGGGSSNTSIGGSGGSGGVGAGGAGGGAGTTGGRGGNGGNGSVIIVTW